MSFLLLRPDLTQLFEYLLAVNVPLSTQGQKLRKYRDRTVSFSLPVGISVIRQRSVAIYSLLEYEGSEILIPMDSSLYPNVVTNRGMAYSVFYSKGSDPSNETLLFLHGFPGSSYDWRHQVEYFKLKGHSIIVPDMLGYGNTDKPTNAEAYTRSLIAKDMVNIVDAFHENQRIIVIGHDCLGCGIASRLANDYEDRFAGFAFLAVGYQPPNPSMSYQQLLAYTAKLAGYELFGYWSFFADPRAEKFDSFFCFMMNLTFEEGRERFPPTGALEAFILTDKITDLPPFLTELEYKTQKSTLLRGGFSGPLCWYKVAASSINVDDSKSVPLAKYNIKLPVFFGAASQDPVCIPTIQKAPVEKFCSNPTIKEYNAGHWVLWEAKDKVNRDLADWISSL